MNKKFTIFDRYIFKQVLQATLVCLLLFIIVWIAPETLVRIIRQIFLDHITLLQAGKELIYEMPKVLGKAIPVGILLGSLFTFDKLSKDNELSILRGVGLSFTRIMIPVLVLGVILTYFCYEVGNSMIPYSSKIMNEGARHDTHFVYIQKNEQNVPIKGVIISKFTRNTINNLIVINFSNEKYDDAMTFKSIVFAPYANVYKDKWVFPTAKFYEINTNGIYTDIINVKNYEILNGQVGQDVFKLMQNSTQKDRTFTNAELKSYLNLLKVQDYTDEYQFMLSKYYQRFLHPLTCIIFAALGCLLGFSPPRSQRLVGFTIAVGLIFAYYITLPFFDLMAQKGVMLPFLAAAFPIIAFIISIFAIKKAKDL